MILKLIFRRRIKSPSIRGLWGVETTEGIIPSMCIADELITTNLPVSLGQKQVWHKCSPGYIGDVIMMTKLAQINYATNVPSSPAIFPLRRIILYSF